MSTVKIHTQIAPKINYAAHQSAFPVVGELRLENLSTKERIEDLTLKLSASPSFIKEKEWRVDRIEPKQVIEIKGRDLEVDGGFLLELTESVRGQISFEVQKDGETLAALSEPVELLAYNEWGGAGFMPELLAAFSMPNDPAVDKIINSAAEILRRAGRSPSMDGYKSGSRERVWEMASSIYSAIANLGLTYAQPPASFESGGQKIRLPSQIVESRVATCLDTAMLFASVLEQAGLNPIIALPKEHALVGVWLQPGDFSMIVTEEAEAIRKRVDLKEMVVVETTFVTNRPPLNFSKSASAAKEIIGYKNDASFMAAVDIKQARAHRINALGLRVRSGQSGASVTGDSMTVELSLESAPALPGFDRDILDDETPDTPEERVERWKKKLLDLTARNPLLNHRAKGLEIICPQPLPKQLADKLLVEKRSVKILPGLGNSVKKQDEEIHRQRTGDEITLEFAKEKLQGNAVLSKLDKEEFGKRSVQIYRKTQSALQEGGANILYLALGFLVWKRERDERRFRAPLILIPVALERRSVISNIEMSAHDDEPRFNTTLLEMLRRDFELDIPGLDKQLPMSSDGAVDVDGIWEQIRKKVRDVAGFEVVEDVVLGHFSFAKYLMWKDLSDRTDLLKEHDVVRHLIDGVAGDRGLGDRIASVDPSRGDVDYKPSDFLTPFLADASQMAAIATAERGKNFIIIGPPGTGKSQTIANMIAHFLGKGKKVLFVSEKTAALEVVHRRLKECGLGRFCLQLHSNKARKADVVKQLGNCLAVTDESNSEEWKKQARKLKRLRDALNKVVDSLHRKRRNGLTAHHALGVKIRDENLAQHVKFSWPDANHHDETAFESMCAAVKELSIQAQAIRNVSDSPFRLVETTDWSPAWERQVVEYARNLSDATRENGEVRDVLCGALDIVLEHCSMKQVYALGELSGILIEAYRKHVAWALDSDGESKIFALEDAAKRLEIYNDAQSRLSCAYKPFAWRELDGEGIGLRWTEAEAKWWLPRFFAKRRVIKEMRLRGAQGKPAAPSQDAKILAQLRREGEEIDKLDQHLAGLKDWSQYATNPEVTKRLCDLGRRIRRTTAMLVHDSKELPEVRAKIRIVLHDGNDLLAPDAGVGGKAHMFQDKLENLRDSIQEFRNHISDIPVSDEVPDCFSSLDHVQKTADDIVHRHRELKDWCEWQNQRTKALGLDLSPLVDAIEKGKVAAEPEAIEKLFESAYCVWWSEALLNEDDVLRRFNKPKHEAKIEDFCRTDDEYREKTAEYIVANIAGNAATQDDDHTRQLKVVERETRKTKRHLPIRQLLERAFDAVMRLTPCFMMSPLSVVQYLAPNQAFDVVIFDEASQITVWDAVGAIARGKQVIVAGDDKQMPPTNFFERSHDDPDGDVDIDGDLESILDEMLAIGMHKHILRLHYRSRKEILIAFSNARYYHNELVTFPSPDVPDVVDKGIRLVKTDGFYERGGSRQNKGEAKAIVKEIVERLTHPTGAVRDLSIGVVTFNFEQQRLIEDLLDKERSQNREIERAFSRDQKEPVFVKNLETVQGDERDVILFSITYGPDQNTGRVPMNFGPLNRQGGERRLNVAMTRARTEMMVFSTLDPDQLDLSRTRARAVKDLKDFLRYAEQGRTSIPSESPHSTGDFESPFEMAVARNLRKKGWKVHPQVGVSNYRIDLGIVHPDLPGKYLAGVECDGAMYHSGASARERDLIRQIILEGLGWKLLRVWSTAWWVNERKETKTLVDGLNKILEEDRQASSNANPETVPSREAASTDAENPRDTIPVKRENASPKTDSKTESRQLDFLQ